MEYLNKPDMCNISQIYSDCITVTLRRSIYQDPDSSAWQCEEKKFHYPIRLSEIDIVSEFDKWWNYNPSLEEIKKSKIDKLSAACNETIVKGFAVTLSDGKNYKFDFDLEAQSNITGLVLQVAAGIDACDYYDCNGDCLTLNANDIGILNRYALAHKSYHIAYFHCLCAWINSLASEDEIWKIQYGEDIPVEYQNAYLLKWKSEISQGSENDSIE